MCSEIGLVLQVPTELGTKPSQSHQSFPLDFPALPSQPEEYISLPNGNENQIESYKVQYTSSEGQRTKNEANEFSWGHTVYFI